MPADTWCEAPSGPTSASRTTTCATRALDERWRMASGKPRTSSGWRSGSLVNVGVSASSMRRSRASPLGGCPEPHESEPRVPIVGRCSKRSTAGACSAGAGAGAGSVTSTWVALTKTAKRSRCQPSIVPHIENCRNRRSCVNLLRDAVDYQFAAPEIPELNHQLYCDLDSTWTLSINSQCFYQRLASSASRALASMRSSVSKPSVNQL